MQPTPNAQLFVPIRDLSKFRMGAAVLGILAAIALFLGYDALRIMSDSEGNMVMMVGGVMAALAVGLWVLGGIIDPGLMSWVELNEQGLRRVSPHVPVLDVPRSRIHKLCMYVVKVSRTDNYGTVTESGDRYELYVDGAIDWHQVVMSSTMKDITHEAAYRCGAIVVGSREAIERIGAEIAAACGVPLDPVARPRVPPAARAA